MLFHFYTNKEEKQSIIFVMLPFCVYVNLCKFADIINSKVINNRKQLCEYVLSTLLCFWESLHC